jgi:hypothetical protein
MISGQGAKAVALDLERAIEARAVILKGNFGRQRDYLLIVEVPFQILEDFIGNVDRRLRHFLCESERGAFAWREKRILLVFFDRRDFIQADTCIAAAGSVDIHSEGTADQLRRAQAHQPLDRFVDTLRAFY